MTVILSRPRPVLRDTYVTTFSYLCFFSPTPTNSVNLSGDVSTTVLNVFGVGENQILQPTLGQTGSNRHLSLPLPHVACQTLNPGAAKSAHSIRLSYLQSDLITAMMAQ